MKRRYEKFMTEIAFGAGAILLKYLNKKHRIKYKPGAGIVTEADTFSEQFLLKNILKKYPNSSIITEETGEIKGKPELMWVMDPLDGTSNFAHGFPWFCVSIGLLEDGIRTAGVIYQPVSREMFFAEKGKGATLNGKKISVSGTKKMSDALLGTGFYYAQEDTLHREMRIFEDMHRLTTTVRRPGSAALDLASVACGRFDGFWERGLSPWDVAAGMLIVEEAGGKVSDYSGKEATIDGQEVVASNGKLHKTLLNVLRP